MQFLYSIWSFNQYGQVSRRTIPACSADGDHHLSWGNIPGSRPVVYTDHIPIPYSIRKHTKYAAGMSFSKLFAGSFTDLRIDLPVQMSICWLVRNSSSFRIKQEICGRAFFMITVCGNTSLLHFIPIRKILLPWNMAGTISSGFN
jgi:hypothetical protein